MQEWTANSFLRSIAAKVRALKVYKIENVDSTVIAQKPKLAPYILQMRQILAKTLGYIGSTQVNVKATTTEGLGVVGKGKAIVAQATRLSCEQINCQHV